MSKTHATFILMQRPSGNGQSIKIDSIYLNRLGRKRIISNEEEDEK